MTNVRRPDSEKQRELRVILRALWDAVAAEPVPQSMHDTLRKLD